MQNKADTGAFASKVSTNRTSTAVSIHSQKDAMVPQFQMLLNGDKEKAERAFRIAVTEYNKSPNLQQCDKASFWGSVINAVQMDLEPGPLGYAFLVPYKGVVTLQVGYRGMLALIMRSGMVESISAYPVYASDKFKFALGVRPDIIHEPDLDAEPTDSNIIGFYAVAHIKNCSIPRIEFMTRKQVDAIKNRSQAKSGPWITDYAEMGRKTVLKRIAKTLPLSVQVQSAIAKDETVRKSISSASGVEFDDTQSVFDIIASDVSSNSGDASAESVDTTTGEVIDGKADNLFK